jgi:DNA-binding MarR family transcriptional regulator
MVNKAQFASGGIMPDTDKQPLWKLLEIVQQLERTVTRTLRTPSQAHYYKEEIDFRQRRRKLFPLGYFADAGWDILLDLYSAHCEKRLLSTTCLGLVGGVPQTTMLRYLDQMVNDGLVARINDPRDGRRIYVELTAEGVKRMSLLFGDATASSSNKTIEVLTAQLSAELERPH